MCTELEERLKMARKAIRDKDTDAETKEEAVQLIRENCVSMGQFRRIILSLDESFKV